MPGTAPNAIKRNLPPDAGFIHRRRRYELQQTHNCPADSHQYGAASENDAPVMRTTRGTHLAADAIY
jgi:hypothetical protein